MKLLSLLSRHAWTLVGVMLMAVIPFCLIHEDRKQEKERLAKDLVWVEWYPGVLELNRQRGKVVWMHFHHDWDSIAMRNRAVILENPSVVDELKRLDAVLVLVDCTDDQSDQSAELGRLGENSLPLDLIANGNLETPLIKLPEFLDPVEFQKALRIASGD